MSDEIAEEYDRLVRPELYREADRVWRDAVKKIEWPSSEAIETAWRDQWRRHLAPHDSSILGAAGFTVDDLIAMRAGRLAKKRNGKSLAKDAVLSGLRQKSLLAIRKADLAGLTWAEAIDFVRADTREAHDWEHDRKTLESWLRSLSKWGLIGIAPPEPKGRGRPRNKKE